jgi:hypothetical protein
MNFVFSTTAPYSVFHRSPGHCHCHYPYRDNNYLPHWQHVMLATFDFDNIMTLDYLKIINFLSWLAG